MNYDATLRNIELIGEAATHIPAEVRADHPEIPWRMIIATRNRVIHGYLGIDNDILWSIICDEIPALLPLLKALDFSDVFFMTFPLMHGRISGRNCVR